MIETPTYSNQPSGHFQWKTVQVSEWLFGLALLSTCFPIKIYPIVFLVSSIVSFWETKNKTFPTWAIFLTIFSAYALINFGFHYEGQAAMIANLAKLLINFLFLFSAVTWISQRDNSRLLQLINWTLHLLFVMVFIQLWVYHQALNFRLLAGSSSSGQASMLYSSNLFFWGLDDKNMLGARIALLGFIYILIPVIRSKRIEGWRIIAIFILAYLSLSRTPIVALLLGCGYLLWASSTKKYRIIILILLIAVSPFILDKVIRIDQLTASNDGMGVRLVYWKAFYEHFLTISPWGNGFMSAPAFLSKYADFYHGEPHIHNTFMTTYLELGIIGFLSYLLFLVYFIKKCYQQSPQSNWWIACFLPLIAIMCILYSGYDNDLVLYLVLLSLFSMLGKIDFGQIKIGI